VTHDHRTMISGAVDCHCSVFRIADEGTFLALRANAATLRAAIEQDLASGFTAVLDFTGVEAITNGYADELVGKLRAQHGDRVRWEGANPEVLDAIQTAISRRAAPTPRS
jgi:hypothetical protein